MGMLPFICSSIRCATAKPKDIEAHGFRVKPSQVEPLPIEAIGGVIHSYQAVVVVVIGE